VENNGHSTRPRLFLRSVAVMSNSLLAQALGGEKVVNFRPVLPAELRAAAAMLLGAGSRPTLAQLGIDLTAIWGAERAGKFVWVVLPMVSPGKTVLLLDWSPITDEARPLAAQLIGRICQHFAGQDIHLAQVLIEPQNAPAQQFFAELGFGQIAELIYLQGQIFRAIQPLRLPASMRFLAYSPQTHALFAEAILQSYRDSLDCPALGGLRDIEDIITGHRSTGEHDPAMWQLLMENDTPLGVVLLSRIPGTDSMELVYLGLRPEARQRGLGDVLVLQAMHLVSTERRHNLSLAVDSENSPALKLYYRHGLQQIATRTVMLRDLRRPQ
jgi:ribosomal protein S18 acetylase RimI-like enzyme